MRERDWQRSFYIPLTILAWLAVAVIAAWILSHITKTILTLVFSAILAFALTPLVTALQRWMPRAIAIALAYVFGFAVVLGVGAFVVATAAEQVNTLAQNLPDYVKHMQPQIDHVLRTFHISAKDYDRWKKQAIDQAQTVGASAAKDSLGIIQGVLGTIVDIILVLILSIYLTANGPKIAQRLRQETPFAQRRHTTLLIAIVNQVVGGYIRGTLTLALLIGFLVGIGMLILHVPYAVLLGILAFFMEFIPIIGVLISGAVCIAIALTQGWLTAVLVLGYFVIVHVIEGDVVGPRILGKAVGIHPATALIALVAGTELFGLWGALLGAPLAGLLQAIGIAAYREMRGGDPEAVLNAVKTQIDAQVTTPEEAEALPRETTGVTGSTPAGE